MKTNIESKYVLLSLTFTDSKLSPSRAFSQRVMTDTDILVNTPEAKMGSVTLTFGWDETKQRFQKAHTYVDQISLENAAPLVGEDAAEWLVLRHVVRSQVFASCLTTRCNMLTLPTDKIHHRPALLTHLQPSSLKRIRTLQLPGFRSRDRCCAGNILVESSSPQPQDTGVVQLTHLRFRLGSVGILLVQLLQCTVYGGIYVI